MTTPLEPFGGNVYRAHVLMVDSGTFWRCAHGSTGHGERMAWIGCPGCAAEDPAAAATWDAAMEREECSVGHLDGKCPRAKPPCKFLPFNVGFGWRWGACVECGKPHPSGRM